MRTEVVLVFATLVALAAAATYTNKFDNIDIDRILNNDRILTQYIRCLMEEGSCTNEGRELKKTLPDALKTGCTKCTEKQKAATEKVIGHVRAHRAKDWERLVKKYDPKGEFRSKYEAKFASSTPTPSDTPAVAAAS